MSDAASEHGDGFEVDPGRCIRCGACALLCPGVFAIEAAAARAARPPRDGRERRLATVALLNCPTTSIRVRQAAAAQGEAAGSASPPPGLYEELARTSEAVRWKLAEVPWERLAPDAAPAWLRLLVKEMAFSEHATYSATQRFMQGFGDDVEFTSWLAVWFYEETRHPHVLVAWLRRVGSAPADERDFAVRGRVSTPFMRSRTGTLVTNVISEVTAATAYQTLAGSAAEPVLAAIAGRISGDEARHAASFFRFARRRVESAQDPARERLDALKVLHFWLNEMEQVTHPVNQMLERLRGDGTGQGALRALAFDFASVKRRVTQIVGLLSDVPLRAPADVLPALKRMTGDVHGLRQDADRPESDAAGRAVGE